MYFRPTTCEQALDVLAARRCTVLAGGTDIYPAHVGRPLRGDFLDITAIHEFRCIEEEEASWRFGASVTWSSVAKADLPPVFRGLQSAALQIGGVQVQNIGTLGGNLCNASPAADGTPNLVALGAEVELTSATGTRKIPVESFITGNRKTRLNPGELLTAIVVRKSIGSARSIFLKLGARKYLVISIASVAIVLESADRKIADIRVAVGSCTSAPCRLRVVEAALQGQMLHREIGDIVQPDMLQAITPIDDVRGTAAYRRDAVLTLVRRGIRELAA